MDAEKVLKGFDPNEIRELAAALPADVLTNEVARRGIEIPAAVGATAIHIDEAGESDPAERIFNTHVGFFLDPEVKLPVDGQLSVMREFWNKLGHEMPQLSDGELAYIAKTVEDHPSHRVVPTPLLSLAERKAIAEKARAFPDQNFSTNYDALWTPDESWTYGKLLRDPESTVENGRKSYGLRYKTPSGQVLSRSNYVTSMLKEGQAVKAEDGTVWTFPVMDVQVRTKRTYDTAGNLHETVDPITSPESLIATQLLHQANGTPNQEWEVDFANEAVYELDKKGNPKALVYVASVLWYADSRQVHLHYWYTDFRNDFFGVRGAESGL